MCSLKCFFFLFFSSSPWLVKVHHCKLWYPVSSGAEMEMLHRNPELVSEPTNRLHQGESSSVTCLTNPHQMELNCKQNCSITVHQPSLSACLSDEAIGKKAPRIGDYRQSSRGGRRGKGEWEQPEREWRERPPCSKSSCADSSASGYL